MKPDHEDEQEDAHRDQAEEADLSERDRPRKQERDLQVEHDEQDGDEVVAHVELHAGVFEGLEAALVRRELLRVAACLDAQPAEHGPEDQQHERQAGRDDEEDQNRQVVRKHVWIVRSRTKRGSNLSTTRDNRPPKIGRDCNRRKVNDGADGEIRTPTPCAASPSS